MSDPPIPEVAAKRAALLALLLLVPVPSLSVAMAMIIAPGPVGQAVYGAGKIWILALPLVWRLLIDGDRPSLSPLRPGERLRGVAVGVGSGLVIAVVVFATHRLLGPRLIDPEMVRSAAVRNGIGEPSAYLGLALYLTLVNSLLEEYVWRWFVFRRCEVLVGSGPAVVASALLFTVHHVIGLRAQMDWGAALLASSGVLLGALIWSWCYRRFQSVWPGFLSHVVADAGIFWVGWSLIFGGGAGG
jgi:membrane protease YdiL (CAAX protease family)